MYMSIVNIITYYMQNIVRLCQRGQLTAYVVDAKRFVRSYRYDYLSIRAMVEAK